ncbi:hypothetical protein EVAR_8384_1 [Eumeta japonica]|uniref:Uncharacterized protein n=1 Tax=Eumeta variegata TaxID=151549 RepID=A0A4C1VD64_EUMVA|nr:hypothetical protein EVAR_8384_1 [Eumeta japonica]
MCGYGQRNGNNIQSVFPHSVSRKYGISLFGRERAAHSAASLHYVATAAKTLRIYTSLSDTPADVKPTSEIVPLTDARRGAAGTLIRPRARSPGGAVSALTANASSRAPAGGRGAPTRTRTLASRSSRGRGHSRRGDTRVFHYDARPRPAPPGHTPREKSPTAHAAVGIEGFIEISSGRFE